MLSVSRFTLTKVRLFVLSPSSHQLSPRKTPTKPPLSYTSACPPSSPAYQLSYLRSANAPLKPPLPCPSDGRSLSPHHLLSSTLRSPAISPQRGRFFCRSRSTVAGSPRGRPLLATSPLPVLANESPPGPGAAYPTCTCRCHSHDDLGE